jgi:hypothetical protein
VIEKEPEAENLVPLHLEGIVAVNDFLVKGGGGRLLRCGPGTLFHRDFLTKKKTLVYCCILYRRYFSGLCLELLMNISVYICTTVMCVVKRNARNQILIFKKKLDTLIFFFGRLAEG